MKKKQHLKYHNTECNNSMTFEECELAILRKAVDHNEKLQKKDFFVSQDIKNIFSIVENFLIDRKCICYGGSAINALLPKYAKIYNKDVDVPDYDFYSITALNDAKELADLYYVAGYTEVEAKTGMHKGTYKVFVNFIPVADITFLHIDVFEHLYKEAVVVSGIRYAPPNYLRMGIYLELSHPDGDISRWEKVFKRLMLINKFYPLKLLRVCTTLDFQTKLQDIKPVFEKKKNIEEDVIPTLKLIPKLKTYISSNLFLKTESNREPSFPRNSKQTSLYNLILNILIEEGVVFFGGYASSIYRNYIEKNKHRKKSYDDINTPKDDSVKTDNINETNNETKNETIGGSRKKYNKNTYQQSIQTRSLQNLIDVPDFDVLTENPKQTAFVLQEQLKQNGFTDIDEFIHPEIDGLIPICYEIKIKNKSIVNVFGTFSCHNYNKLIVHGKEINVATIDTIMSLYLVFFYSNRFQPIRERILCMAKFLFELEIHNRLNQHGILKRFTNRCIGKQKTVQDIRLEKTEKYQELKHKRDSPEYEEWFLNYRPERNDENILETANNFHKNKIPKDSVILLREKREAFLNKNINDFDKDKPHDKPHDKRKYKHNKQKTVKFGKNKTFYFLKNKSVKQNTHKRRNIHKKSPTYQRDPLIKQMFGK